MAVVQDEFTSTLTRTVFTKPADYVRQYSALPRAMVNYSINDGVISAKPINDQQELEIHCVLDPKFAYRLVDMACDVIQDVAAAWDPRGYIEVSDLVRNLPPGARQRMPMALDDITRTPTAVAGWALVRGSSRYPAMVLQQLPGGIVNSFDFHATNQSDPAGAAGVVNSFFSFFEYEIEQAEYVALHYSTLTYQR
jgi:hypothetical protein